MTRTCPGCSDEFDDSGSIVYLGDGETRACSVGCAFDVLDADVVLVEDGDNCCPHCGSELDSDGRTPAGYKMPHCASCAREVEQRDVLRDGGVAW